MSPANKKAYEFAKTICPRSEFKSGRSLLKAAWEIVEPEERKGQELSVSRFDDEEVNKLTLILYRRNEKGTAEKVKVFDLRPDRSGEYYYQSLQINLKKNEDGTVELGKLMSDEPAWKMKPSKLVGQL